MTPFEYVIVLISIILGLGITTILTGVAELIKQSRLFNLFTPYIIWIMLVFVLHINDWWVSYELKSIKEWTLHKFLFILLYPINLYILAHLLFPSGMATKFSSREFYLMNFHRLFFGALLLDVQSIIQNIFITKVPIESQIPHVIVLAVLSIMIITKTKNSIIHTVVSILLLLLLIVSLAIEQRTIY